MARFVRVLLAAASVAALAGPAVASDTGDRAAYGYAIKCYVANAMASDDFERKGNSARSAVYEANAKRSFDGAVTIGRKLGYSNRQLNQDLDRAQSEEMPHMVRDAAYYRDAIATCKALGLM